MSRQLHACVYTDMSIINVTEPKLTQMSAHISQHTTTHTRATHCDAQSTQTTTQVCACVCEGVLYITHKPHKHQCLTQHTTPSLSPPHHSTHTHTRRHITHSHTAQLLPSHFSTHSYCCSAKTHAHSSNPVRRTPSQPHKSYKSVSERACDSV